MSSEIRNIAYTVTPSTSPSTYIQIYKAGRFPGVAGTDRISSLLGQLNLKARLPTARTTSGNFSGRSLSLLLKLSSGSLLTEVAKFNFLASQADYYVNLLAGFSSTESFGLSPDMEIGIQLNDVGYAAALTSGEQLDIYGYALEISP